MIQQQTILKISDNSGAKTVKCIKILKGFKRKFAYLGNTIIVSIQQLRNRFRITSKVQKGEIYKAIILRTNNKKQKKDGTYIYFKDNAASLINKQGKPVATRILGPIPKELKKNKFIKLANISAGFV